MGTSGIALFPVYLGALGDARTLLASDEVAAHWDGPSALANMTVGALAAHLTMATKTLVGVLEERPVAPALAAMGQRPERERTAVDFVTFGRLESPDAVEGEMARWVQTRAAADAERGPAAILQSFDRGVAAATRLLESAAPERMVSVPVNMRMAVEDYVATRLVEAVVHGDDLAASLGPEPPPFSAEATAFVAELLWASLRKRAGDAALVRALARSERAAPGVLRAL